MLFLATVSTLANAKTAYNAVHQTVLSSANTSSEAALAAVFESKFTPYFSARLTHSKSSRTVIAPTDADLFFLAKHWQYFSSAFKSLYLKAADLPSGWQTYDSPGGHFQIIYSLTGIDSVNKADSIGYSKNSWRTRQNAPNGVPDYIDEVAYAADSAWSMEVDRFGFNKPFSYITSSYPSDRFKILVRKFDDITEAGYYGQTYPMFPSGNAHGYSSYFELRSEWWVDDIWNGSGTTNYTLYPENAVRVTCMHEFFHTIQYAMIWQEVDNVWLDDFPISWTEGTAVLMENLGFDYVNDFLQYLDGFFANPQKPMLVDDLSDPNRVYTNSIVTIYLYNFAYQQPGIGFIKDMFTRNYQKVTPFLDNLRASAGAGGRTWSDILGSFFQASYYTGTRAVANRFIAESPLITNTWSYKKDGTDQNTSVTKSVEGFGMNTFAVSNSGPSAGSLRIDFAGDSLNPSNKDTNTIWSINCILKRDNMAAHDSLFSMSLTNQYKGNSVISGWPAFAEALVIVTNGKNDTSRNATVSFTTCDLSIAKGKQGSYTSDGATVAPNATVNVSANEDLFCDMALARKPLSQQFIDSATRFSLASSGSLYDISFPQTWSSLAAMTLTINEPYASIMKIADSNKTIQSSFSIYQWDNGKQKWTILKTSSFSQVDSVFQWQSAITSPGLFGVFGPLVNGPSPSVDVFPNPVHLRNNGALKMLGQNILEVWISSVDGTLISHGIKGTSAVDHSLSEVGSGFWWKLTNNINKPVSPGVYIAVIGYKDSTTKGMKKKMQKIFVLP